MRYRYPTTPELNAYASTSSPRGCAKRRRSWPKHHRVHEAPILLDESRLVERLHQRDAAGGHDVSARPPLTAGTATTTSPRGTVVPSHRASSSVDEMTHLRRGPGIADTGLFVGLLRPVSPERFERQPAPGSASAVTRSRSSNARISATFSACSASAGTNQSVASMTESRGGAYADPAGALGPLGTERRSLHSNRSVLRSRLGNRRPRGRLGHLHERRRWPRLDNVPSRARRASSGAVAQAINDAETSFGIELPAPPQVGGRPSRQPPSTSPSRPCSAPTPSPLWVDVADFLPLLARTGRVVHDRRRRPSPAHPTFEPVAQAITQFLARNSMAGD